MKYKQHLRFSIYNILRSVTSMMCVFHWLFMLTSQKYVHFQMYERIRLEAQYLFRILWILSRMESLCNWWNYFGMYNVHLATAEILSGGDHWNICAYLAILFLGMWVCVRMTSITNI